MGFDIQNQSIYKQLLDRISRDKMTLLKLSHHHHCFGSGVNCWP